MFARLKSEPAVVIAFIAASLGLAVAFGFEMSVEKQASIMALVTVVLGFVTRSQVSPVASEPAAG